MAMTEWGTPRSHSVNHLPVGAFSIVMGIGGLSAAFNRASAARAAIPAAIGAVLAWISVAALAVLLVAYATKAVRHRSAVFAEWRHPVKSAFTATIPIAALVAATALLPHSKGLSAVLWWAGAITMAVVTVWVVRTASTDAQIQHVHVHPAWFIPVVGNIVVPLAGVAFIAAYESGEGAFYAWAGGVTPGIASAIVIALGVRTVRGFVTGELLRPEE